MPYLLYTVHVPTVHPIPLFIIHCTGTCTSHKFFIDANFTAKHALTKIAKGIVKVCKEDVSSAVYCVCIRLLTVVTFLSQLQPFFPLSHDLSSLPPFLPPSPLSFAPLSSLQMREIELCPSCYSLTVEQPEDWFCTPCVSTATKCTVHVMRQ